LLVVALVGIQLVPYGRQHSNPPVKQEPSWDSSTTRDLAVRACYACHSNETSWPWYTSVAPFSWLAQHDVDKGRRELNFSDMATPPREARRAAEQVREGEMPQWYYVAVHPEASLSPAEKDALMRGLEATFGPSPGSGRERERGRG
jgi:hypothetical protein